MSELSLLALAFGLGLLGFIEPCSVGANGLFLGYLRQKDRRERLFETIRFALVRSAVLGLFGLVIAFLGSSVFAAQKSFWLFLGLLYLVLGLGVILNARYRWEIFSRISPERLLPKHENQVVDQRGEMRYTYEHGYASDYMPALQQRKYSSQRDDLQLQAALSLQGLLKELPRGPSAKRLHQRQTRADTPGLPGKIQPARSFPNLWRLAQHRDELARKKYQALPQLSETLTEADPEDPETTILELDELWSFVLKKERKRWVWLALCRSTRQVVAYYIGDRSEQSCRRLWERVPEVYRGGYCYSDFWKAYQEVIPEERHEAVGKESGQTSHIERWNNTLRQRLSRFVRKSLSFSKSDRMHEVCLRLFLHRYNLSHLP